MITIYYTSERGKPRTRRARNGHIASMIIRGLVRRGLKFRKMVK